MFRFGFGDDGKDDVGEMVRADDGRDKVAVEEHPFRSQDTALYGEGSLKIEVTIDGGSHVFTVVNGGEDARVADLIPGVYEGGRKLWEASVDLVEYLVREKIGLEGKRVLELGCGHGLPGILALQNGAKEVVFLDYNEAVIREITKRNIDLNGISGPTNVRLFYGDWSTLTNILSEDERFDVILSAETIYDPEGLQTLARTVVDLLADDGQAFISAKTYYFGVGGGTRPFRSALSKMSSPAITINVETVHAIADGKSNVREVLHISKATTANADD